MTTLSELLFKQIQLGELLVGRVRCVSRLDQLRATVTEVVKWNDYNRDLVEEYARYLGREEYPRETLVPVHPSSFRNGISKLLEVIGFRIVPLKSLRHRLGLRRKRALGPKEDPEDHDNRV